MSVVPRAGWAVRREACLDTEEGAHTWDVWWACCPYGMIRNVDADNNSRCDFSNTTQTNLTQCANSSLIQWSDIKGNFCCESGLYGFSNITTYSKGCLTEETLQEGIDSNIMRADIDDGASPVPSVIQTATSTPTSTISSATAITSSQSSGSSSNKVAIIGGTIGVGLLVGVAWLLLRRRQRHKGVSQSEKTPASPAQPRLDFDESQRSNVDENYTPELDNKATRAELSNDVSPSQMLSDRNHTDRKSLSELA